MAIDPGNVEVDGSGNVTEQTAWSGDLFATMLALFAGTPSTIEKQKLAEFTNAQTSVAVDHINPELGASDLPDDIVVETLELQDTVASVSSANSAKLRSASGEMQLSNDGDAYDTIVRAQDLSGLATEEFAEDAADAAQAAAEAYADALVPLVGGFLNFFQRTGTTTGTAQQQIGADVTSSLVDGDYFAAMGWFVARRTDVAGTVNISRMHVILGRRVSGELVLVTNASGRIALGAGNQLSSNGSGSAGFVDDGAGNLAVAGGAGTAGHQHSWHVIGCWMKLTP